MRGCKQYFCVSLLAGFLLLTLSACQPEVGSKQWCSNIEEKPKADWSANEVVDYAKNCLF